MPADESPQGRGVCFIFQFPNVGRFPGLGLGLERRFSTQSPRCASICWGKGGSPGKRCWLSAEAPFSLALVRVQI